MENHKKELTISAGKANLFSLAFIPLIVAVLIAFIAIWGDKLKDELTVEQLINSSFWTVPIIIGGIIVHELIHGITWAFFTKQGFRSIRFGIIWKALTPYCHSKEPLKAWQYRLGAVMPAIILGFLPLIIAFLNGALGILAFGLLFTLAASGDFIILWLLRNTQKDTWVEDHPSKPGCYVYA